MNSVSTPERPRQPNRKVLIPVFLVVVFLYWLALYLYVPTLPIYLQSKTSDLALVGTALSMYGLWQLIVRLPLGIAADWLGRRKPIILAWLVLVAAGDLILGSANNIQTAIFGRAMVGVSAATWVPLIVLFSSLFEPGQVVKATATLSIVGFSGRIVASAVNGWLNGLGGYILAFRLAALAALLAAVVLFFLPDTPTAPRKPSFSGLKTLASRRDVMLPSLLQALLHTADFATTYTFIPILARQIGASDVLISSLLSFDLVVGLIGNSISAALANRFGSRVMALASILLLAVGAGGVAIASSIVMVFAIQFCIGLGFGIGYPLLLGLSIREVDESQRTTAMGLHQSVYSLGMFLGPWLSGTLAVLIGVKPMLAVIATGILLLGIAGSTALQGKSTPAGAVEAEASSQD